MATDTRTRESDQVRGRKTLGSRLQASVVARIVTGIGLILGSTLLAAVILQQIALELFGPSPDVQTVRIASTIAPLILGVVVFGTYILYHRLVNHSWPVDLRAVHLGRDLVGGILAGAGLFALALALIWIAGGYSVSGVNPLVVVLPAVTGVIFFVGIEETINRGIVLPELESRLGSWVALVVSSLFFAGYHIVLTTNPTAVAVAVIFAASILIAGAYLLTRQLWLPMAIHAGWNFTQGAIFGIAVSGNDTAAVTLLVGDVSGPAWLTGGAYGLEGSLVTLAVVSIAAVAVAWQFHRQGIAVPRSGPRR